MVDLPANFFEDISSEIQIVKDSTISRSVHSDASLRAVLFGFDVGQELSEHTAAVPAVLHILEGEARVTYGAEEQSAKPGSWLYLPAHMPHSIVAKTQTKLLLLLLRNAKG